MKKVFLMIALATFVGSTTIAPAFASEKAAVVVKEKEKKKKKKECHASEAKACAGKTEGTEAKSCAGKSEGEMKSCCKAKAAEAK